MMFSSHIQDDRTAIVIFFHFTRITVVSHSPLHLNSTMMVAPVSACQLERVFNVQVSIANHTYLTDSFHFQRRKLPFYQNFAIALWLWHNRTSSHC
jgi:hypothetical protein